MEKDRLKKELKPASFIAFKVTASTCMLINEFPEYFQHVETQKQFYLDILCLHLDIYHRLGTGLIKSGGKSVPSVDVLDERIGTIAGIALAYINNQSEKLPFMAEVDIKLLQDAFGKFHNWSVRFKNIDDGANTLLSNFVSMWVEKLSIAKDDLDKFVFYLSNSIRQYLKDPHFKDVLNVYTQRRDSFKGLLIKNYAKN